MPIYPPADAAGRASEGVSPDESYDHRRIEARWSARWEDEGLFQASPASGKPKFSLILLPPCVSAPLHLGHALQAIAQDILARYRRMAGFDVLWLPGLDFAPIATQRAVEKELAAEGLTRGRLGRAAFDERVRRWTEDNSSAIIAQLRALGASCDWRRVRYTMDAESVRSARTAFVRLWDDGLVYQDFREVNWCGSCSSVLSNRQLVRKPGSAASCEQCGTEIELVSSRQWFVSMDSMAAQAIADHEQGRPVFRPAGYGDDYRAWLDGLHDWCVSRQLWLGPRVPVFTCTCGHQFAAVEDPDSCPKCGRSGPEQETDVLDSWFSQAMWQATALGWPDLDGELADYYPTSLVIGSRDSLRLGLSRMVMVSRRLTGRLPFREIALTSIVLRPDSRKMDGAKGTAIYPAPFLEEKGADALRGWAAMSATITQDAAFDPGLVTGWRRVVVKLWNAARLVLGDAPAGAPTGAQAGAGAGAAAGAAEPAGEACEQADLYRRWIVSRLGRLTALTTGSLETFELHRGARALLEFVRGDLCGRYLEAVKPRLRAGDEQARAEAAEVLGVVLRLLHPFLPFVTEELWHRLPGERPLLERCEWPRAEEFPEDREAEEQMRELLGVNRKRRDA